ncbi:MAG: hypothetical protein HQ472_08950 [Ignavibacteria bacterium]|nr:hypothetical protein [Ignavibacteria bacterium]
MKQYSIYSFVFGIAFCAVCGLVNPVDSFGQSSKRVIFQHYYHSMQTDDTLSDIALHSVGGTTKPPTITRAPRRLRLLGRFGDSDTLRYVIPISMQQKRITVDAAFHIIGSWDGTVDDDRFEITVNRKLVFSESFSNTTYRQSFPGSEKSRTYPSRTGARNKNMLGYRFVEPGIYDGPLDATYEIERSITNTDSVVVVDVYAKLKDVKPGLENESWGMEHLIVSVDYELPPSITPTRVPLRIIDKEIIEFEGSDDRAVAGFKQDEDFPGLVGGLPVPLDVHARVIQTRCTSCGDVCLLYTYTLYTDGWVNVWNNREARGESTWWGQFTKDELDSVCAMVDSCLALTMQKEYATSDDSGEHGTTAHCQLLLRNFHTEETVSVDSGEPPELSFLMQYMMTTLKKHRWFPIPY